MQRRLTTDELYGLVPVAITNTTLTSTLSNTTTTTNGIHKHKHAYKHREEQVPTAPTRTTDAQLQVERVVTTEEKEKQLALERKKQEDELRLKDQEYMDSECAQLGDAIPLATWVMRNQTREDDYKKIKELTTYVCISKTQIRKTQETLRTKRALLSKEQLRSLKESNGTGAGAGALKKRRQQLNLQHDTTSAYNPLEQRPNCLHDFFVTANDSYSLPLLNGYSHATASTSAGAGVESAVTTTTSSSSSSSTRDLFLPHHPLLTHLTTYTYCAHAQQFVYESLLLSCNYWYTHKRNLSTYTKNREVDSAHVWEDKKLLYTLVNSRKLSVLPPPQQQESSSSDDFATLHVSKEDRKTKFICALWENSVYTTDALQRLREVILILTRLTVLLQLRESERKFVLDSSKWAITKLRDTITREARLTTKQQSLLYLFTNSLLLHNKIAEYQFSSECAFNLVAWMDSVSPAVVYILRRVCARMGGRSAEDLMFISNKVDEYVLPSWPCVFNVITEPATIKNVFSKMKDCRSRAWQHILSKVTTARNRNRKIDGIFEDYLTRVNFGFVPLLLMHISSMVILGNYNYNSNTPCTKQHPAFRMAYIFQNLHQPVKIQEMQLLNATSSVFYYLCVQHYLLSVVKYTPSLHGLFASHVDLNALRVVNENVVGILQKTIQNVFWGLSNNNSGNTIMRALVDLNIQRKREHLTTLQCYYENEFKSLILEEVRVMGRWMTTEEFANLYVYYEEKRKHALRKIKQDARDRLILIYENMWNTTDRTELATNAKSKNNKNNKSVQKYQQTYAKMMIKECKEREDVSGYIDDVCIPLYRKQINSLRTKAQQRNFCDNISANEHVRDLITQSYNAQDVYLGLTPELYNVIEYICANSWKHDPLPLRYFVYLYHMFVPVCAWPFVERVLLGHEKGNQLSKHMAELRVPAKRFSHVEIKDVNIEELNHACDLALRIMVVFVSLWQYHRQLQVFTLDQQITYNQMQALKERTREYAHSNASDQQQQQQGNKVELSWTCVYYCNCCKKVSNFIQGWQSASLHGTSAGVGSGSTTAREQNHKSVSEEAFLHMAIAERQHGRNFGFVNACVDVNSLEGDLFDNMYCKSGESYFNDQCGKEPLQKISVLGKILKIGNNRMISICPQPACGRISCIPTLSYINAHGFSCAHCRSLYSNIKRRLHQDCARENTSPKILKLTMSMRTSKRLWDKCDFCSNPSVTCWIKYNILCCRKHSFRKTRNIFNTIHQNLEAKINTSCAVKGYCTCCDTKTTCTGEMNRATVRYIIQRYSNASSRYVYNRTRSFTAQRARAKRKFEHAQQVKSMRNRSTATNAFKCKRQKI